MIENVDRWKQAPETHDPTLRFDQETGAAMVPPWIVPYLRTAIYLDNHHEREDIDDGRTNRMP